MFNYELELLSRNIKLVAGIDEVGRGCLAGPMAIGCVLYNLESLNQLIEREDPESSWINDVKDSKKLSAKKRSYLAQKIKEFATSYSVFLIDNKQLDTKGLSWAEKFGFAQALKAVGEVGFVLTDAFPVLTFNKHLQYNLKGGDNLSFCIASASIVAKVTRDALMVEAHESFPAYGFDKHKGYGTKLHIDMIKMHGICDMHRRSFEPIKSMHLNSTR